MSYLSFSSLMVASIAILGFATASAETPSASSWAAQGDALMQEARNTLSHDFRDAEKAYTMALSLEPQNAAALLGMAWVENSNHDFKAGKAWAQKALEQNPRAHDAYALMGDGAVEFGNYEEAFEHYQAALDIRADLSTFSRAAHLLWLNGDDRQAQTLLRKAIASGGPHLENVAWCRAELAIMLLKTGAIVSARQQAEGAVALTPENPRALIAMGRVCVAEGQWKEAIQHFEKSAGVTPTHDALAPLTELYRLTGQEEKAKEQIGRVIAYHLPSARHEGEDHGHAHHGPSYGHSHPASSQLALYLADHDEDLALALEQARAAYQEFPNLHAADALAWSLYKNGQLVEAQTHAKEALRLGTSEPEFYYHAGMIERDLGNTTAAKKHLSHALQLNPAFHPTHAKVARTALAEPSKSAEKVPKS